MVYYSGQTSSLQRRSGMLFKNGKSGLSLLEVLFAAGILAVAMIPIAGVMGYGIRGTQRDSRQIRAMQICQARLNQVMKANFNDVPLGLTTANIEVGGQTIVNLGGETLDGTTYSTSLEVTNIGVNFSYRSINLNNPSYNPEDPSSFEFLAGTSNLAIANNAARRVTIRVSWVEGRGIVQNVQLTSFIANFEI